MVEVDERNEVCNCKLFTRVRLINASVVLLCRLREAYRNTF